MESTKCDFRNPGFRKGVFCTFDPPVICHFLHGLHGVHALRGFHGQRWLQHRLILDSLLHGLHGLHGLRAFSHGPKSRSKANSKSKALQSYEPWKNGNITSKICLRKTFLRSNIFGREQKFWRQQFWNCLFTSEEYLTSTRLLTSSIFGRQEDMLTLKTFLTSTIFLTSILFWRQTFFVDVKQKCLTSKKLLTSNNLLMSKKTFDVKKLFYVKIVLTSNKSLTSKAFWTSNNFLKTKKCLTSKNFLTSK